MIQGILGEGSEIIGLNRLPGTISLPTWSWNMERKKKKKEKERQLEKLQSKTINEMFSIMFNKTCLSYIFHSPTPISHINNIKMFHRCIDLLKNKKTSITNFTQKKSPLSIGITCQFFFSNCQINIYIYIYIYMQHFFVDTNFIKHKTFYVDIFSSGSVWIPVLLLSYSGGGIDLCIVHSCMYP